MSQSKLAAVGAFVTGGVLLFAIGLFMIGDRRLLFVDQFQVNSEFGRITGLQVGTKVRVAGLDAGEVTELVIPSRPSEKFVVRMRVRDDLHALVRTDSTASIQTDGIVGSAFIQIGRGTDVAPAVASGGTITGFDPIEFSDLIEEGRNTFRTVSGEIVDLKGQVSNAFEAITETVDSATALLTRTSDEINEMAQSGIAVADETRAMVGDVREVVQRVSDGEGTIGRLLTDDALFVQVSDAVKDAGATMSNLKETTARARETMDEFMGPGGGASTLVADLGVTLAQTQEVMSDLAENTEAMKRAWPFRGFFQDRGFYDLDSLTAAEYRAGTIERTDRAPLRIWLGADVLFAVDEDGAEVLSDEGRQRLDSAMGDLMRFPRDSPLVVEGYVSPGTPSAFLASEDRALLVRGYLVDKYRRRVTLTGTMPLGEDAAGSPAGDGHWSGVSLALFVDAKELANGGTRAQP